MLVLATSRLLFDIPHRTHVSIMQRFAILILVSDIKSTMLTEGRFGVLVLLTIVNTTVGTIELVLCNYGEVVLIDDFIDQYKAKFQEYCLYDVPMTPP